MIPENKIIFLRKQLSYMLCQDFMTIKGLSNTHLLCFFLEIFHFSSFLQGLWGSAFSILLNRINKAESGEKSSEEDIRNELKNKIGMQFNLTQFGNLQIHKSWFC